MDLGGSRWIPVDLYFSASYSSDKNGIDFLFPKPKTQTSFGNTLAERGEFTVLKLSLFYKPVSIDVPLAMPAK